MVSARAQSKRERDGLFTRFSEDSFRRSVEGLALVRIMFATCVYDFGWLFFAIFTHALYIRLL